MSAGENLAKAARRYLLDLGSDDDGRPTCWCDFPGLAEKGIKCEACDLRATLAAFDAARPVREAEREYLEANEAAHNHARTEGGTLGGSLAWDRTWLTLKQAAYVAYEKLLAARRQP